MFKKLIETQRVVLADGFDHWSDAVRAVAEPLLRDDVIEQSYINAMIANIEQFGPYIVIAPDVAMPHAQGSNGVKQTAVSFMKVNRPIEFSEDRRHHVRLLFVLASVDNNSHLEMLEELIHAISDEGILEDLLKMQSIEDLKAMFLC